MPYKSIRKRRRCDRKRNKDPQRLAYKRKYKRKIYHEHPKSYIYLRYKYGITVGDKKKMYKKQRKKCGICKLPMLFREAHIDHNHKSGRVRSLVHRCCNLALGHEENSPGLLLKVLSYKRKWDQREKR